METLSQAARPIMWNISQAWVMYLLMCLSLAAFFFGIYRRIAIWRRGKPDNERLSDWGKRLLILIKEVSFQKRVRKSRYPGLFHSLVFYSFVLLAVVTGVVALDYDFGTSLFTGYLYVGLTVAAELAGILILIGVGMATWRRFVRKPQTLPTTFSDMWPLLLLALMTLTGFVVEGLRIAAAGDKWAALSFFGYGLSFLFEGLSFQAGRAAHKVFWWVHTVLAFGLIATIPFTKFVHLLSLPANVFFSKLKPWGELKRVDILQLMESEDFNGDSINLGLERTGDFTWKQLLDFDACISCGRCEEVCPATHSGHPFSPKNFIINCRDLSLSDPKDPSRQIVGTAFDSQFIWYCRTCMACMEVCPACVDHVDTLIEVRRNQLMIHGSAPPEAMHALKTMEARGNPYGPQHEREEWVKQLEVRIVGPGETCDLLYWIGCCTTFDPTKQPIAIHLCRLLQDCGYSVGILGPDEHCCGDPARVLGDERLFQEAAKKQVEKLNQRDFKILLTSCPHCYNVLKNEYPQFNGNYHVIHHSELMYEMMKKGKLLPKVGVTRRIVYHDPCYLGRYQKIFDPPREVLRAVLGAEVVEMRDNREKSFCCGAGGGHFWMDIKSRERINNLRVIQARDANADTIVTGCPYCERMLEDGVKQLDLDEQIEVVDLATLLVSSLPGEKTVSKRDERFCSRAIG